MKVFYNANNKLGYHYCIYQYPFRILYNLKADDKSPKELKFSIHPKVPDYILELLNTFVGAFNIYTSQYNLLNPLKKGIYYDKGAAFIDVMIAKIPVQKGLVAAEPIDNSEFFKNDTTMHGKSIRILLDRNLIKKTATPIHELFHVFQYNYCSFNNMWFMEGLARWSQNLTHKRNNKKEILPQNMLQLNILLDRKHDAEYFWRELISQCNDKIDFIKILLEESVKQASLIKDRNEWSKNDKKSFLNNKYIFKAIISTIEILDIDKSTQLKKFINTMKEYNNIQESGTIYISKFNESQLASLENIEYIDGDLIIENTTVTSLNSFNKLRKVKNIKIKNNDNLVEICGFNGLESIDNIEILKNENLEKIYGFFKFFNSVKIIDGYIKIESNKKLTNIKFLKGLISVGSSFYMHNNNLDTIEGLENLENVNASLSISGNNISDLTPLKNLTRVNGMLGIAYNKLVSLEGLENLKTISVTKWGEEYRSVALHGNSNLKDLSAIKNCISNTEYFILYLDAKNSYLTPNQNSVFYTQTIEIYANKKKVATKNIFKDYVESTKIKILFYDKWKNILKKNIWLKPFHLRFKSADEVISFSKKHGITYIYGQVYGAQKFLFLNKKKLMKSGLKFLANNYEVSKVLLDKKKFYEHMIKHKLSNLIPIYYSNLADIKYPCVSKKTTDSNGQSVRIIYNKDELGTIASNEVVNEYIIGNTEYAANFLYKDGEILEDVTYKKSFDKIYYVLNSDIKYKMLDKKVKNIFKKKFEKIFKSFSFNGGYLTCCIDYKLQNNIPKIFEINARFGYTLARNEDDFKLMMQAYMLECDNEYIS